VSINTCRFFQATLTQAVCLIGRNPREDCSGCKLYRPDRRASREVWTDDRRIEALRKLAQGDQVD
jgi:hypothetical protein